MSDKTNLFRAKSIHTGKTVEGYIYSIDDIEIDPTTLEYLGEQSLISNPPLTESEIRERVGKWVWVEFSNSPEENGYKKIDAAHGAIYEDIEGSYDVTYAHFDIDGITAIISDKQSDVFLDRIYDHELKGD